MPEMQTFFALNVTILYFCKDYKMIEVLKRYDFQYKTPLSVT